MKKSLIYTIVGFVTVVFLPIRPASANDQQLITVPDAGFDDHVLNNVGDWIYIGDSSYTGAWKSDDDPGDGAYIDYRYWDGDLPARSGLFKAYPSDGESFDYIYQILDEKFVEGATYTLSVWVGNAWPAEGYADGWGLYFTAEDYKINLAEAHGLALSGDWEQISLEYTVTAADAGKRIGIKMSGEEGESYVAFEDVTLYGPPKTRDPVPADGAMIMDTWVNLSWTPANFAVTNDVYMGDNFDDVSNGTGDTFRGSQDTLFYFAGFAGGAYPDGLVNGMTYYWRIDGVNDANPNSPLKGDVWSFTVQPKTAYSPDPAAGSEFVDLNVKLSWTPGYGAKLHTVYFGEDFDAVSNATGGTASGLTTYNPGPLKMAKTYYWRVDESDGFETVKGQVWSFTTRWSSGCKAHGGS